jgi:hypothetical protein
MVALGVFEEEAFTAGFSPKIHSEGVHKLTKRYTCRASSMIKIILIAVIYM